MKNLKIFFLLASASALLSCEPEDLRDETIQGTWYISWVNDFAADPVNPSLLGSLCQPGNRVELNVVGNAETKFQGNRYAYEPNTYLRMGDRSANSNTLVHKTHYLDCNDISVSSIEHRDIYITGQPGYISKQVENGKCFLQSDRARTRPKYTVFINLLGEQTRTQTGSNGQSYTQSDRDNRLGQITYDCDDGRVEVVSKSALKKGTYDELKKNSHILNNKDLFK